MPSPEEQLLQEDTATSLDSPAKEKKTATHPLVLNLLKEKKPSPLSFKDEIKKIEINIDENFTSLTQIHQNEITAKIQELKKIATDENIVKFIGREAVNNFLGYNLEWASDTPPRMNTIVLSKDKEKEKTYHYRVIGSDDTSIQGEFYFDRYIGIGSLPEKTPEIIRLISNQNPLLNLTSLSQCLNFHKKLVTEFHARFKIPQSNLALKGAILFGGLVVGGGLTLGLGVGFLEAVLACLHEAMIPDLMNICMFTCGPLGSIVGVRISTMLISKTPEQLDILFCINKFEAIMLQAISKKIGGSNPAIEKHIAELEAQAKKLRFHEFATSNTLFSDVNPSTPADQRMVDDLKPLNAPRRT